MPIFSVNEEAGEKDIHSSWAAVAAFILLAEYFGCAPLRDVGQLKGIVAASVLQPWNWDREHEGSYIYEQKVKFSKALRRALEDNDLIEEVAQEIREFFDGRTPWEDVVQILLATPDRFSRNPRTTVPAEKESWDCFAGSN